ncbi:hypothetical protein ACFP1Z_06370 [Streptomyces gamaensis]|uniref:Transmembrane protein n=1 Tax=Streptomyces gamaensis TaxID=1763542 RepID=A0ABW0YW28_9ACTN
MHMNSAPHLLAEDRPEFERVLDQALRSADHDPEMAAVPGQRLTTAQLRGMALDAMADITASATAEYSAYVKARDALRAFSAAHPQPLGAPVTFADDRDPDGIPAPAVEEEGDATDGPEADPGAGAGAVLAVLAPVLAGIAALLFLLVGYALRAVDSNDSVADSMITVGWWFAGLTAVGVFVAMTGLLATALRNGRGASGDPRGPLLSEEAERAREAWRQALLHRGLLPFLRAAVAQSAVTSPRAYVPRRPEGPGRAPNLGYSRPGFSSREETSSPGTRPRFTSPDYTSPEYGGPDSHPE